MNIKNFFTKRNIILIGGLAVIIIAIIVLVFVLGGKPSKDLIAAVDKTWPAGQTEDQPAFLSKLDERSSYAEIIEKVAVGVYYCSTDGYDRDAFRIHSINKNVVEFSVEWVRINSIDNAIVEISGTKGNFTWEKESGEYVVGQIEFVDEKTIILSVKETTLYEIEPKSYKYEYFGTEEDEAVAYNKMVLLDLQSEKCGWSRTTEYDIHGKVKDMFIRFNSDGSMIYWVGEPLGGDTIYSKFTGKYKVTKDKLYIGDCAYSLYAYTAGSTIMTLKALGDYKIDFSGQYFCENDEMFQFLYADN